MTDPNVVFTYTDIERAIESLEQAIEARGPFDILLGFSQAAVPITCLTAMRLKRQRNGGAPPEWKMNVLVCGIPPRDKRYVDMTKELSFPCCLVPNPLLSLIAPHFSLKNLPATSTQQRKECSAALYNRHRVLDTKSQKWSPHIFTFFYLKTREFQLGCAEAAFEGSRYLLCAEATFEGSLYLLVRSMYGVQLEFESVTGQEAKREKPQPAQHHVLAWCLLRMTLVLFAHCNHIAIT